MKLQGQDRKFVDAESYMSKLLSTRLLLDHVSDIEYKDMIRFFFAMMAIVAKRAYEVDCIFELVDCAIEEYDDRVVVRLYLNNEEYEIIFLDKTREIMVNNVKHSLKEFYEDVVMKQWSDSIKKILELK